MNGKLNNKTIVNMSKISLGLCSKFDILFFIDGIFSLLEEFFTKNAAWPDDQDENQNRKRYRVF